jgi:hypothetical protein
MTAPITWENGTANAGKPMDAQTVETTGDVLNDADHRQAEAMVARYEYRVSLHAGTGQATGRQRVEVKNLAHWRRRLNAIETKTSSVGRPS